MKLSQEKIQSSTTGYLKSVLKDGLIDVETEDMIYKELYEVRNIKQF
jgi:hypothetical protein|tara:strand:+ start:297 stop:437 length:141 start_codon:yes stop_codon:yes gene_type:complete